MKYYFFLLVLIVSCNDRTDSFYENYTEEDLYRIPLIEPYQLTQLYGMREDEGLFSDWSLKFKYGGDSLSGLTREAMVLKINVSKRIIYGHSEKKNNYPDVWFVIIPDQKVEKVFKDKENEWIMYLKQRDIDPTKQYSVRSLFYEFKKNRTLPWYNPSKSIYP